MLRNKKSLAFVLALVMMLTLIPASAFAATTAVVDRVTTVAADKQIPNTTISFKVGQGGFTSTAQAIKLSLTNGTWEADVNAGAELVTTAGVNALDGATGPGINVAVSNGTVTASALSRSTNSVELAMEFSAMLAENDVVTMTMQLHSGDEDGEVKVTINPLDSQFLTSNASKDYVVATVGSGKTSATVNGDLGSTWRTDSFTAANIEIRENSVNSVDVTPQLLRFTLPSGMTWKGFTVGGNMPNTFSYHDTSSTGAMTVGTINTKVDLSSSTYERDLYIYVTPKNNQNVRELLSLTPIVGVNKDANLGDIHVTMRNESTGVKTITNFGALVVGKYVEESVKITTVKEAEIPTLVAGRVDNGSSDYELTVVVEEVIASALSSGRFIDFELPENVQLAGTVSVTSNASGTGSWDNNVGNIKEDTSAFEYTLPSSLSTTVKEKFTFKIPVTVEANAAAGDLKIKVSGAKAGLTETTITVGKISAPITVEATNTDLRTGVQNQALNEIVIKENAIGQIRGDKVGSSDRNIVINVLDISSSTVKDAKVEVISGDIELGKASWSGATIIIPVKSASVTSPASIKISGATITLDRNPAEGKYSVGIGGTALVDNANYKNYDGRDGDFENYSVKADYITVVTPADSGVNALFVIGQKSYTSNGKSFTMDAAPYIDSASRTMVPIRYVANAMGVAEEQVVWNQATQTATIFGKNMVSIKVGSNVITSNGTPITMDTVAVNNAGRIYVPVRYVSNALGANVAWDQAAQTATIYTVK